MKRDGQEGEKKLNPHDSWRSVPMSTPLAPTAQTPQTFAELRRLRQESAEVAASSAVTVAMSQVMASLSSGHMVKMRVSLTIGEKKLKFSMSKGELPPPLQPTLDVPCPAETSPRQLNRYHDEMPIAFGLPKMYGGQREPIHFTNQSDSDAESFGYNSQSE